MAGKTNFGKINADIQKAEEDNKNRGGQKFEKVKWLSIKFGDTVFSVLPPYDEDSELYEEVFIHHNFVDEKGNKRAYKCSKQKYGKCPICEKAEKMLANELTKEANAIKAQKTFLYNVVDIAGEMRVAGLKPSQHAEVRQELNAAYIDGGVDATDPHEGKQIKLSRMKIAPWARARILGKPADLIIANADTYLGKLANLKKVYIDNTPEDLEKMLKGEEINHSATETKAEEAEETTETAPVETKAPAKEAPKAAAPAVKTPPPAAKAPEKKVEPPKPAPKAAAPAPKEEEKEEESSDEWDDLLKEVEG